MAADLEDLDLASESTASSSNCNSVAGGASVSCGECRTSRDAARCKRNIRMMLVFQLLNSVAWSVCMGSIFDRYLYYLGSGAAKGPTLVPKQGRNSLVGLAESISGLSSLFLAIPVGLLVDRHPGKRARLLRISSIFAVTFTVIGIVGVLTDFISIMYLSLVMQGLFFELSNSASEAIFADSIPQGQRSKLFTTKAIVSTVGSACGPALAGAGLWYLGDEWAAYQMKAVFVSGSLLMPISCVSLFFFSDPDAAVQSQFGNEGEARDSAAGRQESAEAGIQHGQMVRRFGPLRPKHVPVILAASDFMTCIGAGMTVKFFNLFFISDQHFSPVQISMLTMAYPLMISIFMKFTERLSKPLGRAQASLLFFSSNVICLFLLSRIGALPVLLAVYLVRGGLANSTYPIDRSILMDFTPSSQRGRWNAVETFTSTTWSGSAFIGGMLSDQHDYRFTFGITALVYALACLVYSPLLWLIPRRESQAGGDAREQPLVPPEERAKTAD